MKKKKKELSEKQELKTTRDKSKYIILFCFVEVTVLFCWSDWFQEKKGLCNRAHDVIRPKEMSVFWGQIRSKMNDVIKYILKESHPQRQYLCKLLRVGNVIFRLSKMNFSEKWHVVPQIGLKYCQNLAASFAHDHIVVSRVSRH